MNKNAVAWIFREVNGLYYVCDHSLLSLPSTPAGRAITRRKPCVLRRGTTPTPLARYLLAGVGVRSLKPYR